MSPTRNSIPSHREIEYSLLENLLLGSLDSIYFKDLESRFIRVSDFFFERMGMKDASELFGKTDFDLFDAAHAQEARNDELEIIETGQAKENKLEKEILPDGRVLWVLTSKMPLKDETGKIIGTFGISRDITAQKEAEFALEKANQNLVSASRRAGMAEIAVNILHNIGNVLNSINISSANSIRMAESSRHPQILRIADLLEANTEGAPFLVDDERGRQIIPYIRKLSGQMDKNRETLVEELRGLEKHLSHIKAVLQTQQSYAKPAEMLESFLVSDTIVDAVHLNRGSFQRHTIKLEQEIIDEPKIESDKHRLLQILVNFIQNAKNACDEHPKNQKTIWIGSKQCSGNTLEMWVADNGVGILPENMPKLFQHGFTTRAEGNGFGLHSCANLATELGGKITVESQGYGEGSKFTLTLPITRERT
jgi:two-component system NtrC family sensor kinase